MNSSVSSSHGLVQVYLKICKNKPDMASAAAFCTSMQDSVTNVPEPDVLLREALKAASSPVPVRKSAQPEPSRRAAVPPAETRPLRPMWKKR